MRGNSGDFKGQRILLLDADVIAYRFASAGQQKTDWGDGVVSLQVDELADAARAAEAHIEELIERLDASEAVVCFSDPHANWRKEILPSYKANRKASAKPQLLYPLRDHLAARYATFLRPALEGDDVMGILATWPKFRPGAEKVIVSIDKDMLQIPGVLYNPTTGTTPRRPSGFCDRFHMLQTLTGDPVDNYKGCPGIGPVKADEIVDPLGDPKEWWADVVAAYESKGLTEQDALVQARVARILRHGEYDYGRRKPILWNPPRSQARRG